MSDIALDRLPDVQVLLLEGADIATAGPREPHRHDYRHAGDPPITYALRHPLWGGVRRR